MPNVFRKKQEEDGPLDVSDPGEFESESDGGEASEAGRKRKKLPIVVGILVVVLVAAGIGFWVWHEQPSFCNAICHSPMDTYVENYYEGNTLAHIHEANGVSCLQCHEPKIDEQVAELGKWVIGDFNNELDAIDYDGRANCLKCHVESDVQQATSNLERNPHTQAHQVLDCTDCHRSHSAQVNFCGSCHDNGGQTMITYKNYMEQKSE